MKTIGKSRFVYVAVAALALTVAACGNSQKQKQAADKQAAGQPQDSVMIIETETMVVAVDSVAPDSMAMKKAPAKEMTPKKTK